MQLLKSVFTFTTVVKSPSASLYKVMICVNGVARSKRKKLFGKFRKTLMEETDIVLETLVKEPPPPPNS